MGAYDWLKQEHPIYTERKHQWERDERRLRGGADVARELRPFDWELPARGLLGAADRHAEHETQMEGEHLLRMSHAIHGINVPLQHYRQRQEQAMYVNFPDALMSMLTGHLFKKRPTSQHGLSFGTLGEVEQDNGAANPSDAEIVYYNADGVGNDGSQWDGFWASVVKWSGATGHRWVMVEATTKASTSRATIRTQRPYLCDISPIDIPNWDEADGELAWAVHIISPMPAKIVEGHLVRSAKCPRRLYVRAGYTALGEEFRGGGWWTFDDDLAPMVGDGMQGQWNATGGKIPLWAHFYERDKKKLSRAGTTEMGNAAVAYMNLDSAATFDAWDAAKSETFLLGVDPEAYAIAVAQREAGSQWIPIPVNGETKQMPMVVDSSAGAVPADVFLKRMTAIRDTVREVAGMEATSTPDSSGKSKLVGFGESKAPRLGLLASEVETSQNIAIYFLEQRFGHMVPSGSVSWTRDFDLAPILDSVQAFFDIETLSGLSSPTAGARAMMLAVEETGIAPDDKDKKTIEDEYKASAQAGKDMRAAAAGLLGAAGASGSGAGSDPGNPEPGNVSADPKLQIPEAPRFRPLINTGVE